MWKLILILDIAFGVDLSMCLTAYKSIMFHRLLPMQERSLLYFRATWQNMLQLRVKCNITT